MYIDTHTRETMQESITKYLRIEEQELFDFLRTASKESQTETYFNGCQFEKMIDEFVEKNKSDYIIDKILFFHLGRRLNSANDSVDGKNLCDLLTTKNAFSEFLSEHDLVFYLNENHISFQFKGVEIDLSDTYRQDVPYLRSRLGYNSGRGDYCINGFALKDNLLKNSYARNLSGVPEILSALCRFLHNNSLGNDYMQQSKYYCFEYLIPIDDIIFDGFEIEEIPQQKQKHLFRAVFTRLNEYLNCGMKYNTDTDNPILRLSDFSTLDGELFKCKEEITPEMLYK